MFFWAEPLASQWSHSLSNVCAGRATVGHGRGRKFVRVIHVRRTRSSTNPRRPAIGRAARCHMRDACGSAFTRRFGTTTSGKGGARHWRPRPTRIRSAPEGLGERARVAAPRHQGPVVSRKPLQPLLPVVLQLLLLVVLVLLVLLLLLPLLVVLPPLVVLLFLRLRLPLPLLRPSRVSIRSH